MRIFFRIVFHLTPLSPEKSGTFSLQADSGVGRPRKNIDSAFFYYTA